MATIKQLLNMSPDELEKMTEEQLKEYCAPFLRVVVAAPKTAKTNGDDEAEEPNVGRPTKAKSKDKWLEEANRLMKQLGLTELPQLPPKL